MEKMNSGEGKREKEESKRFLTFTVFVCTFIFYGRFQDLQDHWSMGK